MDFIIFPGNKCNYQKTTKDIPLCYRRKTDVLLWVNQYFANLKTLHSIKDTEYNTFYKVFRDYQYSTEVHQYFHQNIADTKHLFMGVIILTITRYQSWLILSGNLP